MPVAANDDALILHVRLNDFEPLFCTEGFRELLGYDEVESCLESLSEYIHFKGCNFLQMYELTLKGDIRVLQTIPVVDRKHRPVARVTEVIVDQESECLKIAVESYSGKGLNERQRQPLVVIDRDLKIVDLDEAALEIFDLRDAIGAGFIKSVVPPGRRAQLERVYSNRLHRHGVIDLSHETRTRRTEFDFGRWSVTPDGHRYIAIFHRGVPYVSFPTETQKDVGHWVLNLASGRVLCSESWVKRIGDAEDLERGRWPFWLEAVVTEDRSQVEKVCFSPRLPNHHKLYYRLATIEGTVLPVEHHLAVKERDRAGLPRVLTGLLTIDNRAPKDSLSIDLQSIAIEHGLACGSTDSIGVTDRAGLSRILEALNDCGRKNSFSISLEDVGHLDHCSICGSDPACDSLNFVFHGHELTRAELMDLPTRDYSLSRLGGDDSWAELLQFAHQTGFHLKVSLTNDSELRLQLSGSPAIDAANP